MKKALLFVLSFTSLAIFAMSGKAPKQLSFEKAWVRAVPTVSKVSAGFGTIFNPTHRDRKLIKATSPISHIVELHTHEKVDGVMKMRAVEFIKIPKKSSRELKRKSYHIMFIDLKKTLTPGDLVPVTLYFDNGQILLEKLEVKKQ